MNQDNPPISPISGSVLAWQAELIQQLSALKKGNKLPHAVLIELQTDVDSLSLGWQLVSSLLCQQVNDDASPCGQCHHCQLMQANNYPDFTLTTLVENERNGKLNKDIKIDQIRRLIHQLTLTPNLHAGKIALIYPAEKMNQSAANSLLKTLEEPADEATLILMTHHANRLPVTVRSRCQRWVVKNPGRDEGRSWLQQNGMDPGEVDAYLSLSRNDAQMALELYQQQPLKDLDQLRDQLDRFYADQLSVVAVTSKIRQLPLATLRLILKNILLTTIEKQLEPAWTSDNKDRLIELLELVKHTDSVLKTEENNLNLQLQLEDVLISLKQILKRDTHHAFPKPGNIITQYQG